MKDIRKQKKNCKKCNGVFFQTNSLQNCCSYQCASSLQKEKDSAKKPTPEKKCKGTTEKTFGFGCGKPNKERIFGLGKECNCYQNWLLNSTNGSEYLKRVTIKITKPREDLEKAVVDKKERQKLTHLLVNVRNVFHEYIRLRDIGKNCICCGVPYNSNFHASHFYKSELYSNLRYDEFNVFGGCQKCNLLLDGNESGFRSGLIQRYGQEFVNEIDNKAKSYKRNDFHWDRETLEDIRKYYQEKLKSLKV
jgi:hypothetical protein